MTTFIPTSVEDVVARARVLGLVDDDKDVAFQVEVAVVDGQVHYYGFGGCHGRQHVRTLPEAKQWWPLTDLVTADCEPCRSEFVEPSGILNRAFAATAELLQAAAMLDASTDVGSHSAATAVTWVGHARQAITTAGRHLQGLANSDAPPTTRERLSALQERLANRLGGRTATQAYEGSVRQVVAELAVPEHLRDILRLDDSPTALTMPATALNDSVDGEIVATFRRRTTDGFSLLLCPRYVADYLQRRISSGLFTVTTDVSTAGPAEIETALGLWDPDGRGELACFDQCLEAARLLVSTRR